MSEKVIFWIIILVYFGLGAMFEKYILHPVLGHKEPKSYQVGDIIVLGDNGSMRLAKPEDIDNHELGMIISTDTISLEIAESLYTRDTAIVECIVFEPIYHNGIKVEVGQTWSYPFTDPFKEDIIRIITDIKGDYIEFEHETSRGIKSSFHKRLFFNKNSKLISTKEGYVTMKCKVSNINTSDLKD